MKNALRILFVLMVLGGFIFSANADAAKFRKFRGDAWFARHYDGNGATNEYFLVIADPTIQNARLNGYALKPHDGLDFSDLMTASTANSGLKWWAIDLENSRAYIKAEKKGNKKYRKYANKMRKRGLKAVDKQAWMDDYISGRLHHSRKKGVFWAINGERLKFKRLKSGTFVNPDTPGNGGGSPVPEPATMLLLGSGLVGIAAAGRKKLFKK